MAKKSDTNVQFDAAIQSEVMPAPEMVEATIERDEFASPDFVDPEARLPRIQAVRGESNLEHCGYFVTADQMAQAGWLNFDESQLIEYTFNSGETEQGILLRKPRMIVCPKTPVLAFDRDESEKLQQTVILGLYDRAAKENERISNIQLFQVFLVNSDNQPLHSIPLSYKAKGANQASFSQHWQQFCTEITACHAIENGIAAKPKNAAFKSLCVFEFEVERQLVGEKKKSPCCYVSSHTKPTLETWKQHFLGYDQSTKQWTWEALEPERPLTIPALQFSSSPPLALSES
ncbi:MULTISPECIES: DUF5895 domain-containing protein [unclassified Microcoleus]|uniref:DUF5895 domain-containing protein n=1 Tax=unclassified Microcoleus TaxID=2642155 RepID=UPI002FCF766E